MTREEAIELLENGDFWDLCVVPYVYSNRPAMESLEALDMAIVALRAQPAKLDRSRWEGCEWCENTGAVIIEQHHAFRSKRKRGSAVAIYCPSCGKPLTEDAWAELERRIGGNDGKTD